MKRSRRKKQQSWFSSSELQPYPSAWDRKKDTRYGGYSLQLEPIKRDRRIY